MSSVWDRIETNEKNVAELVKVIAGLIDAVEKLRQRITTLDNSRNLPPGMERWISDTGQTLAVHADGTCFGPNCCIHNPSNHPMRDFKRRWVGDLGCMERICPHGVGHPDPDDLKAQAGHFQFVPACPRCFPETLKEIA